MKKGNLENMIIYLKPNLKGDNSDRRLTRQTDYPTNGKSDSRLIAPLIILKAIILNQTRLKTIILKIIFIHQKKKITTGEI